MPRLNIGTAGWSIPRANAGLFPASGTALERYSTHFAVVEINSSFHRPHRRTTWERWRDSVPDSFRFSVKLPKLITHQRKLVDCYGALDDFFQQIRGLGDKLAVLLVQLPPKLELDASVARAFFAELGARASARVVCEPRNLSWFTPAADVLLQKLCVARVAADPAICAEAAIPGGNPALAYWRLHGSPVVYRSSYADRIADYAKQIEAAAGAVSDVWCIFDNTASSAALGDALALIDATVGFSS